MGFDKRLLQRFDIQVRAITGGTGLILLVASCINLVVSLLDGFSPKTLILSTYTSIGSIMVVLCELEKDWYFNRVPFMRTHVPRGLFYIFIGSLTFATASFSGKALIIVCSIVVMCTGIVLAVCGLAYCFYSFIEAKAILAGMQTNSGENRVILDSPFDPEKYQAITPSVSGNGSKIGGHDDGYYNVYDKYDAGGIADALHDRAGKAVAGVARDEQRQQQYGSAIGSAASNHEYQAAIGEQIAANTDNPFLAMAARNESVQQYAGSAVSSIATNRAAQQYIGETIATAAEDKETQRYVASTAYNGLSSGASYTAGWAQDNAYLLTGSGTGTQ